MITEMHLMLERVANRIRSTRMWSSLAICWLLWGLVGVGIVALGSRYGWDWPWAWAAPKLTA